MNLTMNWSINRGQRRSLITTIRRHMADEIYVDEIYVGVNAKGISKLNIISKQKCSAETKKNKVEAN